MMDTQERLRTLAAALLALAALLSRLMVAGAERFLHGLWVVAAVLTAVAWVGLRK